jgi:uncharacterized iron-regulated protein
MKVSAPLRSLMLFLAVVAVMLSGCADARFQTIRGGDEGEFGRMMADLKRADVVLLGEFHDRNAHHRLQLDIIRKLHEGGVPLAIGLEMFDLESGEILGQWVTGKLTLLDFVGRYRKNWNIDWSEYDAILLYARNNGIPLVGLNVPDDIIARVSRGSFRTLPPESLRRLPQGVDVTIDESYRSFLRDAFSGHRIDEQRFTAFCEAQALRNSTMARVVADYLEKNPGRTVVVITGVGHAMRRAMPTELAKASAATVGIVIPVTGGVVPDGVAAADGDFFVAE